MDSEILKAIKKKGLLLEKEIFELVNSFKDVNIAENFLEQLEKISGGKVITRGVLNKNEGYVKNFVKRLPGEDKISVEKVFIKLGLSLEVTREKKTMHLSKPALVEKPLSKPNYKIFCAETGMGKKLEVKDFVGHFRARFQEISGMLMSRPELQKNLVSINKISSDRTNLSIIGIVTEKRVTKNKNLIITFEDLTGEIKALVKFDPDSENVPRAVTKNGNRVTSRAEVFEKAEELQLDDIVGIRASGNRDILFVHDVIYPDSFLHERTKFNEDICVAFLSDFHCGSDRHLSKSVNNFLNWINSNDETAKKIKYIFFLGDNVDGVGIFPNQEAVLKLKSMKEQYQLFASYLKRIPSNITMFLCPGQHDATRVMEPQPIPMQKYAPELHEMDNLIMVTSPGLVKLLEGDKEFKVLMYHGASIHVFINEIRELRLMRAERCPAKVVKHMLKRRHLAPMHGVSPSIVYSPNINKDPLVISEVPDVMATGDMHRLDVDSYNGVLIIASSCWQAQTPFEEKVGNVPDPAKVPVLNLKTKELKIYDFGAEGEVEREN